MRNWDETEIRDRITGLVNQSFDLTSAPLFRIHWLQHDNERHTLLFVMHHIISDGWSVNIISRDFSRLYEAQVSGAEASLPVLPLHYADYAAAQRSWFTGERLESQLDYWKQRLAAAPTLLELPTDRPRPLTQTFNGAAQYFALDNELSARLRSIAKANNVTLFMLLMAAFNVLLARLSGANDIVVGTPVAGRKDTRLNELVGFFVNTLAIRTDLSENPSFKALLKQVRTTTLDAFEHQDLPFEKLVEEINPERNRSHSPLFQVAFILQNMPSDDAEFGSLEAQSYPLDSGTTKFDLTVACWEHDDSIGGMFEYNTDLFDATTAEMFCQSFETLLLSVSSNPAAPVLSANMLPEKTRTLVTRDWNNTAADYPSESSIAAEFAATAQQYPDNVALVCRGETMTYAELDQCTNQLAGYLIEQGTLPGDPVALCLDRSMDAVIAILAILKAGGAYVPLDPAYPAERLEFMLADCEPRLLLTAREIALEIGNDTVRRINLDDITAEIQARAATPVVTDVGGRDLAYIIYTSGSTGRPKGTLIEQRSVLRLVLNTNYCDFGPDHNIAMLAPISFDASTYEMWGTLLNGGRCIIYPEKIPTIDSLALFLSEANVDSAFITAALFNTIIDTSPEALGGMQQILVGGEALSIEHVRKAYAALPNATIQNAYGPTESTTYATYYKIPRELSPLATSVPIGPPISNTTCYVLDENMNPLPPGVNGELYLGGDGLARGYLNQPELTDAKFVPDPFSHRSDDRLYRTGDLAHWRRDGTIEYVGRIDNQVKMRGFRIELDEIAEVLRQHEQVTNAAVIMAGDSSASNRLLAYVVSTIDAAELTDTLSAHLRERLPEFMVPSSYTAIPKVPLTANGKLDRRALPEPELAPVKEDIAQPETESERLLQTIWQGLLQTEAVGVNDDFFELGGHSILTIKLIKEIGDTTGRTLKISDVFENPTIRGLAKIMDGAQSNNAAPQTLIPVNTRGEELPLFILGKQGLELEHHLTKNRPVYILDRSYFTGFELPWSVNETARIYADDICLTVRPGPLHIAAFAHNAVMLPVLSSLLTEKGYELRSVVLIDPPAVVTKKGRWAVDTTTNRVGLLSRVLYGIQKNASTPPLLLRKTWDRLTTQNVLNQHIQAGSPQSINADLYIVRRDSKLSSTAYWTHFADSEKQLTLLDLFGESHHSNGVPEAQQLSSALDEMLDSGAG